MVAKKLKMTDSSANVMKTFTDYTDEVPVQFLRSTLTPGHPWVGKALRELTLPPDSLVVLLLRQGRSSFPTAAPSWQAGTYSSSAVRTAAGSPGSIFTKRP